VCDLSGLSFSAGKIFRAKAIQTIFAAPSADVVNEDGAPASRVAADVNDLPVIRLHL